MRDKSQPKTGENQPIDLRGCRSISVAYTGIRLLVPDKEAASRLSEALNVQSRLATVRQAALRGTRSRGRDPELFVQDCLLVGLSENDQPVHLISSLLVSKRAWRGGWFLVGTAALSFLSDQIVPTKEDVIELAIKSRARDRLPARANPKALLEKITEIRKTAPKQWRRVFRELGLTGLLPS